MVKDNLSRGPAGEADIDKLISILSTDFMQSDNPNLRKGGVTGLSAVAVTLGEDRVPKYAIDVCKALMSCFADTDHKVRYYAVEALYNVIKVCKTLIMPIFNEVFAEVGRAISDVDTQVRTGGELINKLLKDIVQDSPYLFDLDSFMGMFRQNLYNNDPFVKMFHLGWVATLLSVPELDRMTGHLPDIIDALFIILGDANQDVHSHCSKVMTDLIDKEQYHKNMQVNLLITANSA